MVMDMMQVRTVVKQKKLPNGAVKVTPTGSKAEFSSTHAGRRERELSRLTEAAETWQDREIERAQTAGTQEDQGLSR